MEKKEDKIGELKVGSEYATPQKECRMCKHVLLISFAILFIVMIAVYFQREIVQQLVSQTGTTTPFHSIPPTKADEASTTAEFNQRVQELGQTAFGNGPIGASSKPLPPSSVTVPTGPRKAPAGPPPLLPPNEN